MEKTDNEIIAEFMGVPALIGNDRYQTSWDWLMPVVEKISTIEVFDRFVKDNEGEGMLNQLTIFAPREEVYKAVVEFIKWYNENKGLQVRYTLNPSNMETNELPEEVKKKIEEYADRACYGCSRNAIKWRAYVQGAKDFYRVAIQSKEARIKFLEGAFDDMLKTNEGHVIELESKEEELAKLKERLKDENTFYHSCEDLNRERKIVISTLKKELELCQTGNSDLQFEIDSLTSENKRLVTGILKARDQIALGDLSEAYHQLYLIADPEVKSTEPWKNFESLSQSTDKP